MGHMVIPFDRFFNTTIKPAPADVNSQIHKKNHPHSKGIPKIPNQVRFMEETSGETKDDPRLGQTTEEQKQTNPNHSQTHITEQWWPLYPPDDHNVFAEELDESTEELKVSGETLIKIRTRLVFSEAGELASYLWVPPSHQLPFFDTWSVGTLMDFGMAAKDEVIGRITTIKDITQWENMKTSLFYFILCLVLAHYLEYFPIFFHLYLSGYIFYQGYHYNFGRPPKPSPSRKKGKFKIRNKVSMKSIDHGYSSPLVKQDQKQKLEQIQENKNEHENQEIQKVKSLHWIRSIKKYLSTSRTPSKPGRSPPAASSRREFANAEDDDDPAEDDDKDKAQDNTNGVEKEEQKAKEKEPRFPPTTERILKKIVKHVDKEQALVYAHFQAKMSLAKLQAFLQWKNPKDNWGAAFGNIVLSVVHVWVPPNYFLMLLVCGIFLSDTFVFKLFQRTLQCLPKGLKARFENELDIYMYMYFYMMRKLSSGRSLIDDLITCMY